jgi:hypothetical protein
MVVERCMESVPELVPVDDQHESRCFRVDELAELMSGTVK